MKKSKLFAAILTGSLLVGCSVSGKELVETYDKTTGWTLMEGDKIANMDGFKPKHHEIPIEVPAVNLSEVLQGNKEEIVEDFDKLNLTKSKPLFENYEGKDITFVVYKMKKVGGVNTNKARVVEVRFHEPQPVVTVKKALENMGLPVTLSAEYDGKPVHFMLGKTDVIWQFDERDADKITSRDIGLIESLTINLDYPQK